MSSRRARSIAGQVLCWGLLAMGFGVWMLFAAPSDPSEVTCGGERMTPGHVCIGNGVETYEERLEARQRGAGWENRTALPLVGVGVLLVIGGGVGMALAASPRTRDVAINASATDPGTSNQGTADQGMADPSWWTDTKRGG